MIIAIDAMGGDNAPQALVKGSIEARDEYNLNIVLAGKEKEIKKILEKNTSNFNNIEILDAEDIITNDDKPVLAIRRKKESSMVKALYAVKEGRADALVSAGSTGAFLSGGTLIIGRIEGIERPAIGSLIPDMSGGLFLLIDSGANVDSKPQFLYDFALMGHIYMKRVMNITSPRIALANIGTEKTKGDKLTLETYKLLEDSNISINFVGNLEARDLLRGKADIVVCDGFTGNMILKTIEGTALELMRGLKEEIMSSFRTKIGGALIKPALKNFKSKLDYSEHGGAPFLGVKAPLIKAHGSSDAKAVKNAIRQAKICVESKVNELIEESMTRR
ncbi:MAG TPA: phosphate acyltransferase PlsX [Sedimentibacter sp.]|nr:phosphate acyltransferase PlsX [Sedimentibacter sp.]HRC80089.1 phosphate acyltransferase PlsX [Sedimentibacter sp.]